MSYNCKLRFTRQPSRDFAPRANPQQTGTYDRRNETNAQTDARHLFDIPRRCLHPASRAPNNRARPVLFSCRATEPTDKLHSDPPGNPTKL